MPEEEDRNKRGADRSKRDRGRGKRREHRGSHRSSHRDRRRHADARPKPVRELVSRFWFELLAVGILTLGVFLLVERLQIKAIIWRTLVSWVNVVGSAASGLWGGTLGLFLNVEKSDLVGIVLVLVAIGMIAISLRWRAIQRHPPLLLDKECPKCKRDLHRLKRRPVDRLREYALWIRISRFRCSKCSFQTSVWKTQRERD